MFNSAYQHEEEERVKRQLEEEKRLKEEQQRHAELAKMRELEEHKRVEDERKRQVEKARIEVSFFAIFLSNNCKAMIPKTQT